MIFLILLNVENYMKAMFQISFNKAVPIQLIKGAFRLNNITLPGAKVSQTACTILQKLSQQCKSFAKNNALFKFYFLRLTLIWIPILIAKVVRIYRAISSSVNWDNYYWDILPNFPKLEASKSLGSPRFYVASPQISSTKSDVFLMLP